LACVLIITGYSAGQSMRVTRYAEDEGLPAALVKSVVRDQNGIIWAATDDGLVRFDGREFRLFREELPGNYAKSVFLLTNGEMLVTSDMGITRFSEKAGILEFDTIAKGSMHQSDSAMWFPKMLYRDTQNRIWLSDNFRIYRFNGKTFKAYNPGSGVATNNYNRSFSFADDGQGNLFAFSETGLVFVYQPETDVFVKVKMPADFSGVHAAFGYRPGVMLVATRDGLFELQTDQSAKFKSLKLISTLEVSYIAESKKGTVYAGTWANGLHIVSGDPGAGYQFEQVIQYTEKDVSHIFFDDEDNMWIASDIGILLLQETLFGSPFRNYTSAYIQNITPDSEGSVYFTDGKSVFRSDNGQNLSAIKLFEKKSVILQVIPDKEGIWISDAEGVITFSTYKGAPLHRFDFSAKGKAVFRMVKDKAGNIWACQDASAELIRILPDFTSRFYGPSQGLESRAISLAVSGSGQLYCGGMTDSAYLSVYSPYIDKFTNLSEHLDFERNIDINVNDIACVSGGNDVWLGTSFGLISLHKGKFSRINLGNLTDNSIKAVATDSLGYVWFANNKGLHRYRDGDMMSFDERSGLPSKNIAYRGLMTDTQNRLWVGTLGGVAVSSVLLHPRNTHTPSVRSLLINNELADVREMAGFRFSNKSFINLKIAAPEFPAKQLSYERWIEGLDTAWVSLPNDGIIILGGLKPGKYKLKIRARQSGNFFYSEPFTWDFEVNRIWYERWWVSGLLLLLLVLIYRVAIWRHSRKLRYDNEKLERIILERTQEIIKQRDQIEVQSARILSKNEALSLKNEELELAKNLAEEAAKAKSQFLSVMSHEIRTPMNAVIGVTHLLMRDNPRPEQLEDLKILRFSAENLLGLINDVLDLNKIEAGKLVIESIDFNLKNLAEGVYSSMLHKAKEKGIELRFEYDKRLPLFMVSDPLRIAQILNNLVSNAIKFTEKGGVMIDISLAGQKAGKVDVEFKISDTGIGIPQEMHSAVFAVFTQASSDTSRKYGGSGLGLAITGKLLEMLGSEIVLKSETGEGSEFSFVISMHEGQSNRFNPDEGAQENENFRFSGQRILLVEDNKINELIARKFMEDWNLKVDSAVNGLQAIEKLNQENYHLILMDLQMPEMDGYKTSSIIRGRGVEPFISVPIIALTASSRSEVQERINHSGINDFVSKPFNPSELLNKLKQYLAIR